LKGSEAFVEAGRLTTIQLNLLGLAGVLAAGLLGGYLLALMTRVALEAFARVVRPRVTHAAGIAAAVAALLVSLVGTSGEAARSELSRPRGGSVPKVALVGVDGCDWERLMPLVEAGRLSTFERLLSEGSHGPLRSLEKLVSPRIWTTIATGKEPAKHGILDFVNAAGVPVNSTMRTAAPVWEIVSANGLTAGVIGWYVTWPVDPVNGFLVSDRMHSLLRGPVQIWQSLGGTPTNERIERFGAFEFDPGYDAYPASDKRYQQNRIVDEPLRWGYLRDHIYSEMAARLYPLYRPHFAAIYFRGVDFVEHFFWKYSDPGPFPDVTEEDEEAYGEVISRYYEYQDRLLERLLRGLGDDVNVILVSDHGFQARTDPPENRPQLTGMHDRTAVLIAAGPAFRKGVRIEDAAVEDVTPTVLAVMGLPVPEDMDGRVLTDIIEESHLRAHPLESIASYEPLLGGRRAEPTAGSTMDDSIREQLKSLGYIE
ncbi:MAG: sulfatase-like hydrolase/transferase, partial [Candidatus Eisenbacteria bacterium]|nr:sulfatase-like hydrolase/transferase [Candidatus Eisenbacteria bacterium]